MEDLGKYIDPFTDFGFKRLFGSEPNKDLLIDFLNELLKDKEQIKHLTYAKNEHSGQTDEDRKAIFDLYCVNERGEKFIVELQKAKQRYFKDRSLFYATFPIQEQGRKGKDWNFKLNEVYTISIMDFAFDDNHPDQFLHEVKLMETQRKEVFYDKLTFVYLEMTKFNKTEEELVTHFDKWLFLLKNLHRFQEIPAVLQEKIFRKAFKIAEVANLNKQDMEQYQASLKYKRDWKNTLDYAIEEAAEKAAQRGMEKGIKKGMEKVAKGMKQKGYALNEISEITGLSLEKIKNL